MSRPVSLREAASSFAYWRLFAVGAALGAVSALGRPGGDLLLVRLLALLVLLTLVGRMPTIGRALALGAGFGCGDGVVSSAGSISWGWAVPVTLTFVLMVSHTIPLALWTHFAARTSRGWARFLGTVCVSALLAQAGDLIGFPTKLATAFVSPFPELVAGARLIGADLVTGLLEATLVEVALSLTGPYWTMSAVTAAVRAAAPGLAMLGASSAVAHVSAPPATGQLQVGIPQVNADSAYYQSRLLAPAVTQEFNRNFGRLLSSLETSDLVVTPEAYDGSFSLMFPGVREAWSERSQKLHQAAVVTSYWVDDAGGKINAAGVFAADGRYLGAHEKIHLAPFGEAPLTAGAPGYQVFEVFPGTRLGVTICLESYLRKPGLELVRERADLIAVTTSDVTFGSGIMVFEHLAMSQVRAIELGRSLIWASNAGPSGVIGRFGGFDGGPFRESAAVRAVTSTYSGQTPYVRLFEVWWSLPCVGLLIALRRLARSPRSVRPSAEELGVGRSWLGAWSLCTVPALVLAAPVLIELQRGVPVRGPQAASELWSMTSLSASPDPFARFRTEAEQSAAAALAYLLEYYGAPAGALPASPPSTTIGDVRARLRPYGISLREIDLFQGQLRVAALVRLRDGTWGVVDSQEAGVFRLVAPHSGRAGEVNVSGLRQLVEPVGWLPLADGADVLTR